MLHLVAIATTHQNVVQSLTLLVAEDAEVGVLQTMAKATSSSRTTVVSGEPEEEPHARRSGRLPDVFGSKDWGGTEEYGTVRRSSRVTLIQRWTPNEPSVCPKESRSPIAQMVHRCFLEECNHNTLTRRWCTPTCPVLPNPTHASATPAFLRVSYAQAAQLFRAAYTTCQSSRSPMERGTRRWTYARVWPRE